LLAVIHGYGDNGWRDSQATQTFLLKNVVGAGMATRQLKEVSAVAKQGQKRPQLQGDVIDEVLGGTSGYLYYSGANYAWYDPKTFKGDPEPGMFHGTNRKVKK
jgi:subtilisin family serine protease